jgi:hypothetical protein
LLLLHLRQRHAQQQLPLRGPPPPRPLLLLPLLAPLLAALLLALRAVTAK